MGLRFRKSIKICKGVKVNISKSGLSLSVGTKGASLNFSDKGTRVTAGLAGTGLSYSTMLSKNKKSSNNSKSNSSYIGSIDYSLDVDEKGKILILDNDQSEIKDPLVLNKIKATNSYKQKELELNQERELALEQYVQQTNEVSQKMSDIYKYSAYVRSREDFLKELQGNVRQSNQDDTINLSSPNELLDNFYKTISNKRQNYTQEQLYDEKEESYLLDEEKKELLDLFNGDQQAICDKFDKWISSIELPVEINIDYNWDSNTNTMMIDTDLPEIEDIPNTIVERSDNDIIKEKKKTQETIRKEYIRVIFGLAVLIVSHVFDISPAIENVIISGYTQRRNKLGDLVDIYVYSLKFERSQFEHVRVDLKDPLEFCLNTTNRINMTSSNLLKEIVPY